MRIPTEAGPDTICICGHWWEEHTHEIDDMACGGCDAAGLDLDAIEHEFIFEPAENTPEAIADRGGDPEAWPQWVKDAIDAQ